MISIETTKPLEDSMFQIRLIIQETQEGGLGQQNTGRRIEKNVSWPLVPRQKDLLSIGCAAYPVTDVIHRMDQSPAVIEVYAYWNKRDFESLSADSTWEKVGF